jgi:hypothetical protein
VLLGRRPDRASAAACPTAREMVELPELSRHLKIAYALVLVEFSFLCTWSLVEYHLAALTRDFTGYYQAYWLIGQGVLNPYSTPFDRPFIQNHGELTMWPLGPIAALFPSPASLLVVQDAFLAGCQIVTLRWIKDHLAARQGRSSISPRAVFWIGAVLLLSNPWYLWTASFDFHMEPIGTLFALLAARAFYLGHRSRWAWAACCAASGDVAATYLAGIGASVIAAGAIRGMRPKSRSFRKPLLEGLVLVVLSVTWLAALSALGANKASHLEMYASLFGHRREAIRSAGPLGLALGALSHPFAIPRVLWEKKLDIYANLAPAGLIGMLSPWGFGVPLVVELENNLAPGLLFAAPSFQSLPVYPFVTFGTAAVICAAAEKLNAARASLTRRAFRRARVFVKSCAALLAANTIGWGAVWLPHAPDEWLDVSPSSAATIHKVRSWVAPQDVVYVSQGVSGIFGGMRLVYPIIGFPRQGFPVFPHRVSWWIVAPFAGIETEPTATQMNLIGQLIAERHGQLVLMKDGIFVVRFPASATTGTTRWFFPGTAESLVAYALRTKVGEPVTQGPVSTWRVTAWSPPDRPVAGYVAWGDYFQAHSGRFLLRAKLASSVAGIVNVEAWDADTNRLLARIPVGPTNGVVEVQGTFSLRRQDMRAEPVFRGFGPFRIDPVPPFPGNRIEIRVWTPGGGRVDLYTVSLIYLDNQFVSF